MKTWIKHCTWTTLIVLGVASACGSDDQSTSRTGDGDGDGDGEASTGGISSGDGDGDTGGTPAGDGDGDGTGGSMTVEMTGSACESVDDCYPRVAEGELSGPAMCLDRVEEGYCTHECEEDLDCCAAEGECESDLAQVCAPFASLEVKLCFLSCEDEEVAAAGFESADEFCQEEANPEFGCRSTGGGQANRRVCMPIGTQGMGGAMNGGGAPNLGGGAGALN